MYVTVVRNRNGVDTVLLRESYRDGRKVKNRTLANLTALPPAALQALKRSLAGEALVAAEDTFDVVASRQHGHVEAVLTAMDKLGIRALLGAQASPQRDLVMAMIAARIIAPASKLETARDWLTTSLPTALGVQDATENDLYAAMDWLLDQQERIEKKLAKRHLEPCGLVLYDLTSTYVEGQKCPLATRGHNRDGKVGKLQINFGMMTDEHGRPVAVRVYEGNTADPTTVCDQVNALKQRFGIDIAVFVGDRGMVTQKQIDGVLMPEGFEWITALRSGAIQKLETEGTLQLGLFDDRNLFELESPSFPDERLIACRNPELAKRRAKKRLDLIAATERELKQVQAMATRGTVSGKAEIGVRVGRVVNKFKVAKHFKLKISDDALDYEVRADSIQREAAMDGIYVIRTSVAQELFSAEDAVRHYKRLARVERAFRSMKTVSLRVRPIFHWNANRVRAHIFLCMLAYYVEWHLRHAWAPLLFGEEVDTLDERDPVAPSQPTPTAKVKARTKTTSDGFVVHSFQSLLHHLSSIVRNTCRRRRAAQGEPTFDMTTQRDPLHQRAFALLDAM